MMKKNLSYVVIILLLCSFYQCTKENAMRDSTQNIIKDTLFTLSSESIPTLDGTKPNPQLMYTETHLYTISPIYLKQFASKENILGVVQKFSLKIDTLKTVPINQNSLPNLHVYGETFKLQFEEDIKDFIDYVGSKEHIKTILNIEDSELELLSPKQPEETPTESTKEKRSLLVKKIRAMTLYNVIGKREGENALYLSKLPILNETLLNNPGFIKLSQGDIFKISSIETTINSAIKTAKETKHKKEEEAKYKKILDQFNTHLTLFKTTFTNLKRQLQSTTVDKLSPLLFADALKKLETVKKQAVAIKDEDIASEEAGLLQLEEDLNLLTKKAETLPTQAQLFTNKIASLTSIHTKPDLFNGITNNKQLADIINNLLPKKIKKAADMLSKIESDLRIFTGRLFTLVEDDFEEGEEHIDKVYKKILSPLQPSIDKIKEIQNINSTEIKKIKTNIITVYYKEKIYLRSLSPEFEDIKKKLATEPINSRIFKAFKKKLNLLEEKARESVGTKGAEPITKIKNEFNTLYKEQRISVFKDIENIKNIIKIIKDELDELKSFFEIKITFNTSYDDNSVVKTRVETLQLKYPTLPKIKKVLDLDSQILKELLDIFDRIKQDKRIPRDHEDIIALENLKKEFYDTQLRQSIAKLPSQEKKINNLIKEGTIDLQKQKDTVLPKRKKRLGMNQNDLEVAIKGLDSSNASDIQEARSLERKISLEMDSIEQILTSMQHQIQNLRNHEKITRQKYAQDIGEIKAIKKDFFQYKTKILPKHRKTIENSIKKMLEPTKEVNQKLQNSITKARTAKQAIHTNDENTIKKAETQLKELNNVFIEAEKVFEKAHNNVKVVDKYAANIFNIKDAELYLSEHYHPPRASSYLSVIEAEFNALKTQKLELATQLQTAIQDAKQKVRGSD